MSMKTLKRKAQSIVYINFAPYENAGRILDYLLSEYSTVISFTFNFHQLSGSHDRSVMKEYVNGKLQTSRFLYYLPTPKSIAFLILPIRSIIIFLQIVTYLFIIKKKYGTPDVYFTVNAFIAWCGNIVKKLHLVKKTIFWIWDYYPPIHSDKIVMFMRWLYWQFDKPAGRDTDRVVFLNKRLIQLRKKIGALPLRASYPIVGIGTDPVDMVRKKPFTPLSFVFLGVLKKSQGLDIFFDSAKDLALYDPASILHVIGGGPDFDYFKKRARSCPLKVIFHGYIPNESKVNTIIQKSHIGIAPYIPDESNCTYFSDPSKIKRYINFGLPVVTTNVFSFSKNIESKKAGIIIPYNNGSFVHAVKKICKQYKFYQKNALYLAGRYIFTNLYDKIFES